MNEQQKHGCEHAWRDEGKVWVCWSYGNDTFEREVERQTCARCGETRIDDAYVSDFSWWYK